MKLNIQEWITLICNTAVLAILLVIISRMLKKDKK
jgi:hypothetical protein